MTEASAHTLGRSLVVIVLFFDCSHLRRHGSRRSAPQTVGATAAANLRLHFMQQHANRLRRKPEVGQGIFRDKTVLGERRREDSEGFKRLFVSSPFVIEGGGDYDARLAFIYFLLSCRVDVYHKLN